MVAFYGEQIDEWDQGGEAQDSLSVRTDSLTGRIDGLLERLRMPPELTGIRADTTVTARLGAALGEATGSPYAPSPGRRAQLRWNMEVADRILGEIALFYADELPEYREALQAAGFDLLEARP